jgi:predicted ribosome quality control (RQC) complex YloA/Tae2 family protein
MKLRKHLRTKRLENIRQIGTDRVVDFKFGSGDSENHIILELYSGGNIILTDQSYDILALLRSYKLEENDAIQVGNRFSISKQEANRAVDLEPIYQLGTEAFNSWARQKEVEFNNWEATGASGEKVVAKEAKKSKAKKFALRQLLLSTDSGVSQFGSEIIEHCILSSGMEANTKVSELLTLDDSKIRLLMQQLADGAVLMADLDRPWKPGYIIYNTMESEPDGTIEFVEFLPKLFKQHEDKKFMEITSFDEAVDKYFCKLEEQKLDRLARSAEEAAKKKVDKVIHDFDRNLMGLVVEQETLERGG